MNVKIEYFKCDKCGERLSRHKFYFDGCRRHVESYGVIVRCNEKDCELNHKCKQAVNDVKK